MIFHKFEKSNSCYVTNHYFASVGNILLKQYLAVTTCKVFQVVRKVFVLNQSIIMFACLNLFP